MTDSPEHLDVSVAPAPAASRPSMETRPERGFEGRRRLVFLSLILLMVSGALFIWQRCNTPVDVSAMFQAGSAPTQPARGILPGGAPAGATMTPLRVELPATLKPTAVSTSAVVSGAMICYAARDFSISSGLVPQEAQVRVTGYTSARGGMVQIGADWVAIAWVRCSGDLAQLERPFVFLATSVPTRRVTLSGPVDIGVPVLVVPSLTPLPTVMPTPANGMYWIPPNCWVVQVQGVQQIWVDGKGVSTGTYCGVRDIRIVMGVAGQ